MFYYEVTFLKSSAPQLTYSYREKIEIGSIILAPLKSRAKKAVVVKEVKKPTFNTQNILNIEDELFTKEQLDIANFIKSYYFSSLGEAVGLFYPIKKDKILLESIEVKKLPKLTLLQQKALDEIEKERLSLLFGVTGSGKTEIYIHLIAKALKEKRSAIVLMPEIALTPQITKRIESYFKDIVAPWHSKLTKVKKEEILSGVNSGKIRVIIGARSALFLPLQNLGLIVVDEEHDDSYKAMSRPRYNAKDLAIYIGQKLNIKVVLGSATPLVSSYKKYKVIRLKKAYKEAKKEFKFISGEEIDYNILSEISKRVKSNEQALVFVPTRANFKYIVCANCGKTHTCPYCSIGMSVHRRKRYMQCHYCFFTQKIVETCQFCKSDKLTSLRVGTSEVSELISNEIEGAKIEQFDKDNITTANKLYRALRRVQEGESNVIVGTQMLSKGHDYPEITLSVITGLDYTVAMGDYRAKERAISLMHQIAGRSGRNKDALILIQSSQPDFFTPYIKDYEEFLKEELNFREELYPPFMAIARVLISNKDYQKSINLTKELEQKLREFKNIQIVGAGEAPIEKIANKWRFNILLRAKKRVDLIKALHSIFNTPSVEIDMDPVEFS